MAPAIEPVYAVDDHPGTVHAGAVQLGGEEDRLLERRRSGEVTIRNAGVRIVEERVDIRGPAAEAVEQPGEQSEQRSSDRRAAQRQ